MTDIASLGIQVDATQPAKAADTLEELASAGAKAEDSTKKLTAATETLAGAARAADASVGAVGGKITSTNASINSANAATNAWVTNMRGVEAEMNRVSQATGVMSDEVQKILNRYDPLGTKLRQLQNDFATLRKEMGDSTAPAVMNAFKGLEDQIEKTSRLMATAGVDGFGKSEEAAKKSAFATAGARRELLVLGHEAISGNFSRMPGSFMVLAERMDLTKALLSPMALGFAAVAAVMGTLIAAFVQGHNEIDTFNTNIGMTNNAVGLTRDKFNDMAASIATSANTGIGAAKEAMQGLIATGRFSAESFTAVANTAVAFAERTGESSDDVVKDFTRLSEGVAKWAEQHNAQYHFITTATYEHIRSLEEEGKISEAIQVTMSAMDNHLASNTQHLSALGLMLKDVKSGWSALWDTLKGALNESTLQDKITSQAMLVTTLQDQLAKGNLTESRAAQVQANLQVQMSEYVRLTKERDIESVKARQKSADDQVQQAGIAASERMKTLHEQAMSNVEKEAAAVKKYWKDQDALLAAGGKLDDLETQNKVLKYYHDLYAAKEQVAKQSPAELEAAKAYAKYWQEFNKIAEDSSAKNDNLTKGQAELVKVLMDPVFQNMPQTWKDTVLQQAYAAITTEQNTAATKAYAKSLEDAQIAADKEYTAQGKVIANITEQADAIEREVMMHDKNKKAIEDVAIARLQEQREMLMGFDGNQQKIDLINQEIAARERLVAWMGAKDSQDASDAAIKKQGEAWQKNLDSVNKTGRQMFVDWGMQGANVAQQIGDTLKKALLAAIYDATIQPIVVSVYSSVTGGQPTVTGAANTVNSVYNTGNTMMNMWNRAGQFGTNALNAIGSTYNSITGAAASNVIGSSAASNLAVTSGGTQIGGSAGLGSGTVLGGGSATASSSAGFMGIPVIGWIMAGMAASGSAYDAGFRGNSDAHGTTNPINWGLNAEDRLIGQPLGLDPKTSAILSGSSLGSWASYQVFGGHTLTPAGGGIQGTITANGVSNAQQRTDTKEDHRGFLGMGSYTTLNSEYSALDQGTTDMLNAGATSATAAIKAYAKAIGLSEDAVNSFTKDVFIDLTGLDSDAAKKKIADTFAQFGNDMVTSAYGSAISALAHSGETSSDTLVRLATDLTTVNADLKTLGLSMLPLSVNSAAAAAGLADAAGGLDKLQASVNFYFTHFYSTAEQNAANAANLNAQFDALGKTMPATRQGFRDLVNSIDITTPAGQHLETQLLALAPAFDQVASAAEQANARFQSSYASALQDFGTPEQIRSYTISQIQGNLDAAGVHLTADQIANASKQDAVNLFNSYNAAPGQTQTAAQRAAQQAILDNEKAFLGLVTSANKATDAIGTGTSGSYSPNSLTSATSALASAAKSATDAIFAEVNRIRGIVTQDNGPAGYAQAQARLYAANAAASAGDMDAAARLPQLSQQMLALADVNEKTLADLQYVRAQTAALLERTGTTIATANGFTVPAYDNGTAFVPFDQVAKIHRGEAVITAADNISIAEELAFIRGLMDMSLNELQKISRDSKRTADVTEKSDAIGPAPTRAHL